MAKLSYENMQKLLNLPKMGNFSALIKSNEILPTKIEQKNNERFFFTQIDKIIPPQPSINQKIEQPTRVHKPLAIREQSVSKPLAIREQSVSNPLAIREQTVSNPLAIREQTVSNPLADPLASSSSHQRNFNSKSSLPDLLSGKELFLVSYLIDLCFKNCTLQTPPISSKELMLRLHVKPDRLRNLILRISKKNLIKVISVKSSRQASRVFEFSKENYTLLMKNKKIALTTNNQNPLADPLAHDDVSSSYYNKTTNIPEIFKQIDCSPLTTFGFNESHIIQIYREHTKTPELALSVEIIQNSINALAFDLKHNNVASSFKSSPAVVLTAMLKKGQPYSSVTPDKVLSPREEAMQEYITAQKKLHNKVQELENQTKEFELQEWLKALPEQELATFISSDPCPPGVPERVYQTSRRKKAFVAAQEYFLTILWPQKLTELKFFNQKQNSDLNQSSD
jgi:hypothetical protein